jgi:HEAT repeat protein
MQALMLSSDSDVATEAAMYLAQRHDSKAFELFFEQIPKIAVPVKDRLRSAWYNNDVVVAAAKAIKEKGETTKEGAMTFLNLCYMRDSTGSDEAFVIVASAIPDYSGADADKLAYTVGLFRPQSHQPLIDLLDHSESRVRKTAVTALGKMEATDALSEVKKLKSDSSASVRSAALTAESSINAAIAYSSVSPSGYGNENVAMQSERASAKKRLGMP